jgi:hypothetical protein
VLPVEVPFTFQSYVGSAPSKVAVEVIVTTSPAQIEVPPGAAIVRVGVPKARTDIAMLLLLTVAGSGHASPEVISHNTMSPSTKAVVAYVLLFVPTLLPFNFHWYVGETPPNWGVAVKVTELPVQIVVAVVATDTDGVTVAVIVTNKLPVMLLVHPLEAKLFAMAVYVPASV